MSTVYSDDSLVVQRAPVPGLDRELATSSSTMPSLMARMLHLLDVGDAWRVLEIGTATGYNAALLCHRLGAAQVTSIELHPGLAATAAQHLARLGLRPDPASPLLRAGDMRLVIHHDGNNDTRTTDLDLQVLAESGLRALLGILEPALQPSSHRPGDHRATWFLFTTDNSWAGITTARSNGEDPFAPA